MRYIFVDEAGTSDTEPITIVVGIIAHADAHVMLAESLLAETLGAVPLKFQKGFTFHSTEVWNSVEYRDGWRMTDRLALLGEVMRIPRKLGMAISMGMVRRSSDDEQHTENTGLTKAQFQHLLAFQGCLARADKYIREYADPHEVATVVAEDVPEMRKYLRGIPQKLRENNEISMALSGEDMLKPTAMDQATGYVGQEAAMRVSRTRKSIHFVEKDEDPLVQIADACAFGFRRYFSQLEHGPEFVHAILGGHPNRDDYSGPSSYMAYFFHPSKKELFQQWNVI